MKRGVLRLADFFVNRYEQLTGDSADDIVVSVDSSSLRVNPLRASEEEVVSRLRGRGVSLSKVPFLPLAYSFKAPFSLGATEEYLLGLYYLQEQASQLPVVALGNVLSSRGVDVGGLRVLDMCVAPGSKTTQLAAFMRNEGVVVALDSDMRRCESLANNLERCGVSNTSVFHKDARFVEDLGLLFDVVFLDAPCSGNFCSEKGWFKKRKMTDPRSRSSLQEELLAAGLRVLKPGGLLVYSTCSLEVEEDERVVSSVSSQQASLVDMGLSVGSPGVSSFRGEVFRDDISLSRRLWPHRDGTQGFFLAVFEKN